MLFPNRWDSLVDNLLNYLREVPNSMAAVLKLIQNISNKYSSESRSDPLYEEIIFMCDKTHDFLLDLTLNILQGVKQNPNNIDQA